MQGGGAARIARIGIVAAIIKYNSKNHPESAQKKRTQVAIVSRKQV
jgi:hypothetical protein